MQKRAARLLLTILLLAPSTSAVSSAETTTNSYDVQDRIVKATHSGGVIKNVRACYKINQADDRTNVMVTISMLALTPCS
jgi:hypothetical protein